MTDNENGSYKYPQLVALIKCVLSLRHGNAVPERGFSINKILLESHGYTIQNDTIVCLCFVKDEIQRVDGVLNVKITRELMDDVKNSHKKYEADRKQRQELKENELASVKKHQDAAAQKKEAAAKEKVSQVQRIHSDIKEYEMKMKCADAIIIEAKDSLQNVLKSSDSNKLSRNVIQSATAKIEI